RRQRADRKHRRPPPPHHLGKGSRRAVLRSTGPQEEKRQSGFRLREQAACRNRQEPGPEPLHPVKSETRRWKLETRGTPRCSGFGGSEFRILRFVSRSWFSCLPAAAVRQANPLRPLPSSRWPSPIFPRNKLAMPSSSPSPCRPK